MAKAKRIPLRYRTKANDIKYQGPFSYRYIRIIGWVFMTLAQLAVVLKIAAIINPGIAASVETYSIFASIISTIPLPLFLLANFGIILNKRHNFKYLLVFYGGMALLMYVVANIIVMHYVFGLLGIFNPMPFFDMSMVVGSLLENMGPTGYLFNIFIDLFLCVLSVFFIFYNPKKHFVGKKIIYFRLMALIPVLYEITSLILKHYSSTGAFTIPSFVFFLLTSKPPFTFVAFFVIVLILKIREYRFLKKHDNNLDLLAEHYSTNAHSFRTSITIAIVFAIVSMIDGLAVIIYAVLFAHNELPGHDSYNAFMIGLSYASKIGLGESLVLLFVAPIALLYSYTRTHKNTKIDPFIPFIGIGLIIFTYLEASYWVVKLNFVPIAEEEPQALHYIHHFDKVKRLGESIRSLF